MASAGVNQTTLPDDTLFSGHRNKVRIARTMTRAATQTYLDFDRGLGVTITDDVVVGGICGALPEGMVGCFKLRSLGSCAAFAKLFAADMGDSYRRQRRVFNHGFQV